MQEAETKQKLVSLNFRVRQEFADMLDEIIRSQRGGTRTEVFRAAVNQYYRRMEPPYLKPSINQRLKQDKVSTDKKMANMTAQEWVEKELKGKVMAGRNRKDGSPQDYCVAFGLAQTLRVVELSNAREFFSKVSPNSMTHHLAEVANKDLESAVVDPFYKDDLLPFGLWLEQDRGYITTPENWKEDGVFLRSEAAEEETGGGVAEEEDDHERVDEEDSESLI